MSTYAKTAWAAVILAAWVLSPPPQSQAEETSSGEKKVVFESDIAPLLQARCHKCHAGEMQEAGLDLRRRFTMLTGGDGGPVIVIGRPENSLLVEKLESGEMPPEGEPPLSMEERDLIKRWIAAGATVAADPEPPLDDGPPPSSVTEEDRQFWAFQPPRRPPVPDFPGDGDARAQIRTPVDAFLLAELKPAGLTFNPEATRETLLRRLCYDLWGLPPTPEQQERFLADTRPDAYERLVEELLASPHYGVRWGRHWLDVAGYADSDGYLAADRLRPEAWRYRDYVISAHNADLPYDQFLVEQIAGDELSSWRQADELTPDMQRQLTATGYLRTALDPTYPGYTEPNEIHQVLSDTVQIVGTSLLGLTMHCARCHAHKFDPISQRDYYEFQAIFLPALDPARWLPSETRGIPLATEAQQAAAARRNEQVDKRLAELTALAAESTRRAIKKQVVARLAQSQPPDAALVEQLVAALSTAPEQRSDEQKSLVARHAADLAVDSKALAAADPQFAEESQQIAAAVAAETSLRKSFVLARGLTDLEGPPPPGRVLRRGDYSQPGAAVDAGLPDVLAAPDYPFQPTPGYKTSGRRLAFARWLADPRHPLTARVHVNRIWKHHFGRLLVATPGNFGKTGARPSHPLLLDWLATELVREGYSVKSLHRLLLLSTAYRQSSESTPMHAAADPENRLYGAWHPRRLEGEALRDGLLAASGQMHWLLGGPPAPVVQEADGSVVTGADSQGRRRSAYLIVRRSQHLTLLDLFDTPVMETNCLERNTSIVPLQALALMHGPFSEEMAAALAERILRERPLDLFSDEDRTRLAWRLLYGRDPGQQEIARLTGALASLTENQAGSPEEVQAKAKDAWTQAALVMINSNEFLYLH